jgi:hypothetical protein
MGTYELKVVDRVRLRAKGRVLRCRAGDVKLSDGTDLPS